MRFFLTSLIAISWMGCGPTARDTGDETGADACVGLECRISQCEQRGLPPTTVSGTVYAPNGTLALYGATVYIPGDEPGPLTVGAECTRCMSTLPGGALVNTTSDTTGKFTLLNVPAGRNVPLIVQIGKWRRKVEIPEVFECTDNALPAEITSLPRNKSQGDLPRIAISTGNQDALECLIKKIGVDVSEFTPDSGDGAVHLFHRNGISKLADNTPFNPSSTLWSSVDKLKQYDLAMFACEGNDYPEHKPQEAMNAVKEYADLGGRVFMSHYHKMWIGGNPDDPSHAPAVWPTIARCDIDQYASGSGMIDTVNNPKGGAFATWMQSMAGTPTSGQIPITNARQSCSSIDTFKAERWVYFPDGNKNYPMNFQFTTPNEVPEVDRCGKVVFSDMHVSDYPSTSKGFPDSCSATNTELTPQEKALAFMFFDIASCVGQID